MPGNPEAWKITPEKKAAERTPALSIVKYTPRTLPDCDRRDTSPKETFKETNIVLTNICCKINKNIDRCTFVE